MGALIEGLRGSIIAVNPVPWARAQMAFTLAFHIILVPLGVSWAFMALIANYRGIKHGDADALQLAQRWSKYMAVTFAVGAVTGTVLRSSSACCGPVHGPVGRSVRRSVRLRGDLLLHRGDLRLDLHLRLATAVAVGALLDRGAGRAHRHPRQRLGRCRQRLDELPQGFTLDSAGNVVDVDPLEVIFNDAMPLMAAHMVVAAYVVGGFLVASVYAVGMLRGRRDRYHRLGFLIPFSVAAVAIPLQMAVGDSLARWVYNNQPTKFAAIELVPETESDVPETLLGRLNSDVEVTGGIRIPGLASWLSDPSDGTGTVVQGLDSVPAEDRPTISQVNTVHLAWDVMVGLGTLLFLLSAWYWLRWIFRRDMPKSKLFLRIASCAGVAAIVCMEAGWVVSEVGRQPWIVYKLMKVEDAATGNTGVWITFVLVAPLYIGLGITTVLILRKMSRRFRERGVAEHEVPYGPGSRLAEAPEHEESGSDGETVAALLFAGSPPTPSSAAPTSAPASGTSSQGVRPRRAPPGGDRPFDRPGVGGQPCVADLRLRRAVDGVLRGLRLDHPDSVRAADDRGSRHRATRIELRLPQDGVPHPRSTQFRRGLRPLLGARPVLLRRRGRRHRLRPRASWWGRRRSMG